MQLKVVDTVALVLLFFALAQCTALFVLDAP
jgi:hypothetical protein